MLVLVLDRNIPNMEEYANDGPSARLAVHCSLVNTGEFCEGKNMLAWLPIFSRSISFSEFGEVAPKLIQDYQVPTLFQEDLFDLMDDLDRPPFRWLVIGPPRSGASWHVDPALTSAWNTLLRGRKRWALYPPGRVPPSVIVHGDEEDGEVDIDAPSSLQWWMDIYPVLKDEDRPLECIQVPGQTIFVPSGWWHCVLNLEDSVAVTQNFVDATNFDLVCLDLTPGHHHKAVARAGKIALEDCASIAAKAAEEINGLGSGQQDWEFTVDYLALYVDHPESFTLSQSLRKWLRNLWLSRSDLQQQIWKGACIAFDAEGLLERVILICTAHNLPLPTDAEKLPLGHGSNPVFLVGSNVIKICIDDAGQDKAIDGVASELQFYSQVKSCRLPLKDWIPKLVGSGLLYSEEQSHRAVTWDGKDEPRYMGNKTRQGKGLISVDFHRARWNQAVMNPDYLDSSDDDEPEDMERTTMVYPYIITSRCKGDDFAHMRGRMQESHILAMADMLGKHVRNLHSIPLPAVTLGVNRARKQGEGQQRCETNGKTCNHQLTEADRSCLVPNEWVLFITMMRRQREQVMDQVDRWKSVPHHLIAQLEDYLPVDPLILAGVSKAPAGVSQMGRPVWLHMDVTDENIQVVFDTPPKSAKKAIESGNEISACYLLDFGDVCLGDPLYELVGIYLDVFLGNPKFLKTFLTSYGLSLSPSQGKGGNHKECAHELSYRAMCYTLLHEENAVGAAFNIWEELKTASTWKEVEQKVWGCLSDYTS